MLRNFQHTHDVHSAISHVQCERIEFLSLTRCFMIVILFYAHCEYILRMVVQQLAKIQIQSLQLLKRINPKNIAVLLFQWDTLMIHDDVFDVIE